MKTLSVDEFIKTLELNPKDMVSVDSFVLKPDGSIESFKPKDGTTFTLEEVQNAVGGYVQPIYMGSSLMLVNEDGLEIGLPYNSQATKIYTKYFKTNNKENFIVGDVLLCPSNMLK
tara:strand:- start:2726 stop:3073 length:348 start_codon:yes stop_codon:yes gene_type:complete